MSEYVVSLILFFGKAFRKYLSVVKDNFDDKKDNKKKMLDNFDDKNNKKNAF